MQELPLIWRFHPLLIFTVLGLLWGYGRFWSRLKQNSETDLPNWRAVSFASSLILLLVLTASPLDWIGQKYLLTIRMLEMIALIYVLPCLFWLGIPPEMVYATVKRFRFVRYAGHLVGVSLCFNVLFLVLHIPVIYQAGLVNNWVHELQLAFVFVIGTLMWWPLLCSFLAARLPLPRQMFYLVTLVFAQVPLFALLTFSHTVLYPSYVEAARISPLDAYGDQQLAGWALKTISSVIFAAAFIRIFLEWNRQSRQQDFQDNITAFENFELVKRAPVRKG